MKSKLPLLGFSAYSGTGKTTLLRKLIPLLKAHGLRIAVIKHAHHDFDLDMPGKDSYELRKAGADETIICTMTRMARIVEFERPEQEPDLQQIIDSLDTRRLDLILVEGYKDVAFPKIELHREAMGKPFLFVRDESVIAVASDVKPNVEINLPYLDINNIETIAEFIYQDFYQKVPANNA
ncbi:MAG: molybdopterin-guanine dinucleotide biosynthesis protein B [Pseudomonadota bacterium]